MAATDYGKHERAASPKHVQLCRHALNTMVVVVRPGLAILITRRMCAPTVITTLVCSGGAMHDAGGGDMCAPATLRGIIFLVRVGSNTALFAMHYPLPPQLAHASLPSESCSGGGAGNNGSGADVAAALQQLHNAAHHQQAICQLMEMVLAPALKSTAALSSQAQLQSVQLQAQVVFAQREVQDAGKQEPPSLIQT